MAIEFILRHLRAIVRLCAKSSIELSEDKPNSCKTHVCKINIHLFYKRAINLAGRTYRTRKSSETFPYLIHFRTINSADGTAWDCAVIYKI